MTKRRWNLSLIFTWARYMKSLRLGNAFGRETGCSWHHNHSDRSLDLHSARELFGHGAML